MLQHNSQLKYSNPQQINQKPQLYISIYQKLLILFPQKSYCTSYNTTASEELPCNGVKSISKKGGCIQCQCIQSMHSVCKRHCNHCSSHKNINNIHHRTQEDLYATTGQFKTNKMVLNPQRSNYMVFSAGKVDNNVLDFKIGGDTIIKVGKLNAQV